MRFIIRHMQIRKLLFWDKTRTMDGQAHGLSFSVKPGVPAPPSLQNMFKELQSDLGCPIPDNGYLVRWAEQGVLLLNTVLTVRAGEANSHKGKAGNHSQIR